MTIEDTAEGIISMRIRGAARIATVVAEALIQEAKSYVTNDISKFEGHMRRSARKLLETRPSAVSLKNSIRMSLRPMLRKDGAVSDVEELRRAIVDAGENFIEQARRALDSISEFGSKRVKKGSVVLTHCNSNAALSVIERAFKDGMIERVFATESRPWNQGHITVRRLAEKGIPVTLIVDSAVRFHINDMDIVIFGADTISSNGAVINKIGSSQIALCASEARVEVMVAAETFKFSPGSLEGELVPIEQRPVSEVVDPSDFPGVDIANPVFDTTPPDYIDVIVTEKGIISPHAAYRFAQEFGTDLP